MTPLFRQAAAADRQPLFVFPCGPEAAFPAD